MVGNLLLGGLLTGRLRGLLLLLSPPPPPLHVGERRRTRPSTSTTTLGSPRWFALSGDGIWPILAGRHRGDSLAAPGTGPWPRRGAPTWSCSMLFPQSRSINQPLRRRNGTETAKQPTNKQIVPMQTRRQNAICEAGKETLRTWAARHVREARLATYNVLLYQVTHTHYRDRPNYTKKQEEEKKKENKKKQRWLVGRQAGRPLAVSVCGGMTSALLFTPKSHAFGATGKEEDGLPACLPPSCGAVSFCHLPSLFPHHSMTTTIISTTQPAEKAWQHLPPVS